MAVLVDYECGTCGVRAEHWAPSPPPTHLPCPTCNGQSRRAWAAIGLSGTPAPAPTAVPAKGGRGRSICSDYPQVPGLCHMSESAGRMWVAKYLKDGRSIDREQERQEKQAAVAAPTLDDVITHQHHTSPAPSSSAP